MSGPVEMPRFGGSAQPLRTVGVGYRYAPVARNPRRGVKFCASRRFVLNDDPGEPTGIPSDQ
jgi:hypothetical protein